MGSKASGVTVAPDHVNSRLCQYRAQEVVAVISLPAELRRSIAHRVDLAIEFTPCFGDGSDEFVSAGLLNRPGFTGDLIP